jgi:uncharacterized RDD family membrane protein YckC
MAESDSGLPEPSERDAAGRDPSLPSRLMGGGARGARRVARATGIEGAAAAMAEEAIVRAIESRAAERALARVLEGPVLEEAVQQALRSPVVEDALNQAIDSEMTERVWARLLSSDEAQKLVERIAEAPEVRAAIAAQGYGFLEDVGREVARGAHRLDDSVERGARRLLRRHLRVGPAGQAGLVSRALALLLDGAILNGGFLVLSAAIAFVVSLFVNGDPPAASTIAIGGGLWLIAGAVYLTMFWALAGQTPGMRFLRIRLDAEGERRIGGRRAIRRLLGAALSAVAFGLGFLAVLVDGRRRGWMDKIAKTEVLYADRSPKAAPWSTRQTP